MLAEFDETVLGNSGNVEVDPVENCADFNFTCCLSCSSDAQTLTDLAQKPVICKKIRYFSDIHYRFYLCISEQMPYHLPFIHTMS